MPTTTGVASTFMSRKMKFCYAERANQVDVIAPNNAPPG
jgi:hypothetical protein